MANATEPMTRKRAQQLHDLALRAAKFQGRILDFMQSDEEHDALIVVAAVDLISMTLAPVRRHNQITDNPSPIAVLARHFMEKSKEGRGANG